MVRLFVGSLLKEDEAAHIDQFGRSNQERLAALTASSVRFVKGTNLHITWVFIGEVAEENVPTLQEKLRSEVDYLKTGPLIKVGTIGEDSWGQKLVLESSEAKLCIDVEYDYIEAWPKIAAGRVLVATPTTVPDQVIKIGLALRSAMANLGTGDQEQRNLLFRPHITLVRLNPANNFGDGKLIGALSKVLPIRQRIDSLQLIKSHQGQGAQDYEIIARPW